VLEEVDPGDGSALAAIGHPCWWWLVLAGTGGEMPGTHGEYTVHFDKGSSAFLFVI
jgi:hypothetical protein